MDICRICGNNRQLTKEHIPPKAAGNSDYICVHNLYALSKGWSRGEIFQNGLTRSTLCRACNGKTAGYYVRAFASWTLQAGEYRAQIPEGKRIAIPFTVSALRVAKQLAVMTLAMSEPESLDLPHFWCLRKMVLCPQQRGCITAFRFFAYFHVGPPVFEGAFAAIDTHGGPSPVIFCHVGLEPLGTPRDSHLFWGRFGAIPPCAYGCFSLLAGSRRIAGRASYRAGG